MRLTLFAQFTLLIMLGASTIAVVLTVATMQYRAANPDLSESWPVN